MRPPKRSHRPSFLRSKERVRPAQKLNTYSTHFAQPTLTFAATQKAQLLGWSLFHVLLGRQGIISLCVCFDLNVYTLISMCILRSQCVYFDLYVYIWISMGIHWNLNVYFDLHGFTLKSIRILWSLCVYLNLHGYTLISMCIRWSPCVYFDLYAYTLISMCILWSLCVYFDLYGKHPSAVAHLVIVSSRVLD